MSKFVMVEKFIQWKEPEEMGHLTTLQYILPKNSTLSMLGYVPCIKTPSKDALIHVFLIYLLIKRFFGRAA